MPERATDDGTRAGDVRRRPDVHRPRSDAELPERGPDERPARALRPLDGTPLTPRTRDADRATAGIDEGDGGDRDEPSPAQARPNDEPGRDVRIVRTDDVDHDAVAAAREREALAACQPVPRHRPRAFEPRPDHSVNRLPAGRRRPNETLVMWPVTLPGSWVASTKRCKDAGSADSRTIGATEDAAARRVIAGQGPGERCRLHH